jgi:hypothetical protein
MIRLTFFCRCMNMYIYIYLENAKTIDHPCMADLSTYWQLFIVAAILFVNYYIHCLGYPTDPKHVDNKDPCLWYLYQPEHMVLSENIVFGSNFLPLKREHGDQWIEWGFQAQHFQVPKPSAIYIWYSKYVNYRDGYIYIIFTSKHTCNLHIYQFPPFSIHRDMEKNPPFFQMGWSPLVKPSKRWHRFRFDAFLYPWIDENT